MYVRMAFINLNPAIQVCLQVDNAGYPLTYCNHLPEIFP